MNRQLKFKAAIKLDTCYVSVDRVAVYPEGNMGCSEEQFIAALPEGYTFDGEDVYNGDNKVYSIMGGDGNNWIWFEGIALQWIGREDRFKKLIYEGDIIVNGLSGTWEVTALYSGSFGLKGLCQQYRDQSFIISALNEECEVIGSIYTNPEMILK